MRATATFNFGRYDRLTLLVVVLGCEFAGTNQPLFSEYSSRFGLFVPAEVTLPGVARLVTVEITVLTEAVGVSCRISAATPATCGEAIEVPEIVFVAVLDLCHAEVIDDPGAKISRQLPKFE